MPIGNWIHFYREHFKRFVEDAGYYDLFLISPQGEIVYSQAHESDFATSLITGAYRNSGFAFVVRAALNTLQSGVSDFEYYPPSKGAIAAFMALPIIVQGKLEGVLALQIYSERVFEVVTDNVGLGASGETVVTRLLNDRTALVIAPSSMSRTRRCNTRYLSPSAIFHCDPERIAWGAKEED